MKEGYTVFSLRTCGPGTRHLAPGRAQRVLFESLGVTADEVGGIFPAPDGGLDVEISVTRARRIATPCTLPIDERGIKSVWSLSRPTDPPEPAWVTLEISWDTGDTPSPGTVCHALADQVPGLHGPEDCGVAFVGDCWLQVSVPSAVQSQTQLPPHLRVGGREMTLSMRRERRV